MSLIQFFRLVNIQARFALKADASKFFLGYIWWILEPLLYVAVFYVVFDVILDAGRADFLVFLMCGKLPFIWFSKSVTTASNGIVSNAGLIGKIDVPKTLFPMARIQEGTYKQATVFLLLMVVLWAHGFEPSIVWLWVIPIIVVNYLMIVACAFVGATLVCFIRDFSLLISLGMVFLMFTSGIFWDVRSLSDPEMSELVLRVNPMAMILDAYRQVFMNNEMPDLFALSRIGMVFLAIAAVMTHLMNRNSKTLALRALTA
jgi:lipopolysaccharide transport system permease protein